MSETETPVEILYWHYPDSLEKQVMNDLVQNSSISKKKILAEPEIGPAVERVLGVFEDNDYVTSSMQVDPSDGLTYKRWTVTPFFLSRIQAQRDGQAEQDAIKMALWNQKNQLMAAAQQAKTAMARGAVAAPMDVNMDETESDIHDRIRPELDTLKKKMEEELAEKRRLERKKLDEDEDGVLG